MVRLREVAERAGVSVATASYALRGHALVKPETRARVEQAARALGYRLEVSAAVMAGRRHARGKQVRPLTLGFVETVQTTHKHSADFQSAAQARGYEVEWLRFRAADSPSAVARALWFRRVVGLYLAAPSSVPEAAPWVEEFSWERFAVVKFSRARPELKFDLIRHSAFDYMARSVREVAARGYRRLGVLLAPSGVDLDDEARLGAVLGWAALRKPEGVVVEWKLVSSTDWANHPLPQEILQWLRDFRPEVVVGFPEGFFWKILEAGFRPPREFAWASVLVSSIRAGPAGCLDDHKGIAARAVELLDQKIRLGQLGMAEMPQENVIEPVWMNGETLPAMVVTSAKKTRGAGAKSKAGPSPPSEPRPQAQATADPP